MSLREAIEHAVVPHRNEDIWVAALRHCQPADGWWTSGGKEFRDFCGGHTHEDPMVQCFISLIHNYPKKQVALYSLPDFTTDEVDI